MMWRKNCVAAVPVHLRILLRSQGSLRCLSTHKSKRDFVSVRSERGRWRNESPAGGLTELYVYQGHHSLLLLLLKMDHSIASAGA